MTTQIQTTALNNARSGPSLTNYPAIFEGFKAMGLSEEQIRPRENIFTFHAWKALGKSVMKGQHGVKITTWIPCTKKNKNGEESKYTRPRSTTVFHVSQTETR